MVRLPVVARPRVVQASVRTLLLVFVLGRARELYGYNNRCGAAAR